MAKLGKLPRFALIYLLAGSRAQLACGQDPCPAKPQSSTAVTPSISGKEAPTLPKHEHAFWDKKNAWLFSGVGAARTLDYFSTLNLRRRGDREILVTNDLVDNHAAFAVVEAAGTGVSIGASYLFHRYGHHKLERWTSLVHFGLTTTGAARNYCLKTAHRGTVP
jgi:hypothetical protein